MVQQEDLLAILQEKNIKPSYQRLRVLEYLLNQQGHPTVDEIFLELVKVVPTLSKTTVYNTLDIFLQAGLVRTISIEEHELRYDVVLSTHGHFQCELCKKIYNFSVDVDTLQFGNLENFHIQEKNIYFKGICSQCADSNKK